jgi:acid phosphatase (class A)
MAINANSRAVRQMFVALCGLTAFCVVHARDARPAPVAEMRPGYLAGYLDPKGLPNSLVLLPAPPTAGSAAQAADDANAKSNLALRDSPRWKLAAEDTNLRFPGAAGTFSCALNIAITDEDTPYLYQLLRRSLADIGLSTYRAKDHYARQRPFQVNQISTCKPDDEPALAKDGSYPSGHAAIGWGWSLILSELAPERADALLARGQAFGDSRAVCNFHWNNDVVQGRVMAAATVAKLHADATFRADLAAAKEEIALQRAKGSKPNRDCAAEAAALAVKAAN